MRGHGFGRAVGKPPGESSGPPNPISHSIDWVDDRIARLGRLEFAEARAVLFEDGSLTLPADDRSTFVEFAATYLELAAFHPAILPHTFPAIRDHEAVRGLLREDVDADALLELTRPAGAPASPRAEEPVEAVEAETDAEPSDRPRRGRSPGRRGPAPARGRPRGRRIGGTMSARRSSGRRPRP